MVRESTAHVPFCSSVPLPLRLSQGLPCPHWTSNHGWVPLGVGTPPLPQPPFRGAGPGGPAFTFAPPSLPPTPSGPAWLEGASVGRGSGPGSQQVPAGPSGQGKPGYTPFCSSALPMVPQYLPLGVGSLPLRQPPLRGPVPSHLHFSSPFTLPTPHILPSHWGFLPSPRCPWFPIGAW